MTHIRRYSFRSNEHPTMCGKQDRSALRWDDAMLSATCLACILTCGWSTQRWLAQRLFGIWLSAALGGA
jgi:hypothetical protein